MTESGLTLPKGHNGCCAGAELHLTRNWTATAKFDGEFAQHAQTYAGTDAALFLVSDNDAQPAGAARKGGRRRTLALQ